MKCNEIRILLLEDNTEDINIFKILLSQISSCSFNLQVGKSIREGLNKLRESEFDVIITDLGLGDSQGIETFITVYTEAPSVPIIIISGISDKEKAIKAVEAGAQDYLVKGNIDSDRLERTVYYAIERCRLQKELAEARLYEMQEREFNRLQRINDASLFSTVCVESSSSSVQLLCDRAPDLFKKSVKDFSELLESLVNDPTTRGMSAAIGRIEQMVENIGSFKANASDIIGIYNSFFNEKTKVAKPDEIKAYIEDGHHLFIEIMGRLLNYYRNFVQ